VRDLLPTLCELAGIKVSLPSPLDGRSLVSLIKNSEAKWEDRILVSQWKNKFGVRSQNYRLGEKGELFNMASDPEQLKPIKDEKVSRKLKEALAKYKTEVLPGYGGNKDERDFVIAHPGSKLTQLPARDAVATGGLKPLKSVSKRLLF
jgi:arylsulfatase A-like enzyme